MPEENRKGKREPSSLEHSRDASFPRIKEHRDPQRQEDPAAAPLACIAPYLRTTGYDSPHFTDVQRTTGEPTSPCAIPLFSAVSNGNLRLRKDPPFENLLPP